MSAPTVLIATAKIRAGKEEAFAAWQIHHSAVISKFPGYVSSDMMPTGGPGSREWVIVLNFLTNDNLNTWMKSEERSALIAEALPLYERGDFGQAVSSAGAIEPPGTNVTEVIFSKVKPGMDEVYRAWTVRIQEAQAKHPGYRGMYLQPPTENEGRWTTLLRYDTTEHMLSWMNSPERAALIKESKAFIESEELMRLATAFPGWVPINPETGKGPPDWKTALLVLLGLYPTVVLELRFLNPHLTALNPAFATFIGNIGSVSVTSFITMPLFVKWFSWWLFPKKDSPKSRDWLGVGILIVLFLTEIALLWRILLR